MSLRAVLRAAAVAAAGAALGTACRRSRGPRSPTSASSSHPSRALPHPRHQPGDALGGDARPGLPDPDRPLSSSAPHLHAEVDVRSWRLRLSRAPGAAAGRALLRRLFRPPPHTVVKNVECAATGGASSPPSRHARLRQPVAARRGGGRGVDRGAAVAGLLRRAGLRPGAVDVMPEGLDDTVGDQGRVPPPAAGREALADDTLLVYAMNGRPLPPDHGFRCGCWARVGRIPHQVGSPDRGLPRAAVLPVEHHPVPVLRARLPGQPSGHRTGGEECVRAPAAATVRPARRC